MLDSFLAVGTQVVILFLLVGIGYLLGKTGKMDDQASLGMTNLVVYVVSPAMTIVSFQRPLESQSLHNFFLVIFISIAVHLFSIFCSRAMIRDESLSRRRTLQYASIFTNCGFMAFPLQNALLGSIGIFYGSAYALVFTVLGWTYGVYLLTGDRAKLGLRHILCNPGVVGSAIALLFYLGQVHLPELIFTPLKYMSALNTPLPMVILGYQLSHADLRTALRGVSSWIAAFLGLILTPLMALALCLVLHADAPVTIVAVVAAAAPPAALLSMLSVKFHQDVELASSITSVHTLLSALTMPLIVGLAQYLA